MKPVRPVVSSITVIVLTCAYLLVALNSAFFSRLLDATPGAGIGTLDLTLLAAVFTINLLLLSLLAWPKLLKPAFIGIILLSALVAYFMQHFGAVIDRAAIASVFESDVREASEWLGPRLVLWMFGFGVLPALLLIWLKVEYQPFWREFRQRSLINLIAFAVLAGAVGAQTQSLSSLLRNHGELRHYANPLAVLHATRGYIKHELAVPKGPPTSLGADARFVRDDSNKPLLLMLVVGESARAQSFELNGYDRPTNPELKKRPLLSYFDVHSCGTNTATSLPCMFSNLGQEHFEVGKARQTENLLDVFVTPVSMWSGATTIPAANPLPIV
ncbi:MAG: phosphoethanolamine transferase [Ahniella sp.]|nr:phosphoethanolamine transferase [Ahniella sp.]